MDLKMNLPIGSIVTVFILSLTGIWIVRKRNKKTIPNVSNKLVFITGCDSGFGYSFALHCHDLGLNVCASMLNPGGEAGDQMQRLGKETNRLHVIDVDVTDTQSVQKGVETVKEMLLKNNMLELHAVVNNAGVMVFAESEWQTEQLMEQQIKVNLIGAIRVTKWFSPLLRKYKGRVINISSHCALEALPGLSVYAASKAGLKSWSDGLRVELGKYGVKVISFIPGSFFGQSNILARQEEHAKQMKEAMSIEDLDFYGDYFNRYNSYLSSLSGLRPVEKLKNDKLYKMIEHVLLSPNPKAFYCTSPRRYAFYHFLFKISPVWIRDKLIQRFIQMPKFKN